MGEHRQVGRIGAIELVEDRAAPRGFDWTVRAGYRACRRALSCGVRRAGPSPRTLTPRRGSHRGMNDFAWFVLFAVGWLVLQRVILPRLGVPT